MKLECTSNVCRVYGAVSVCCEGRTYLPQQSEAALGRRVEALAERRLRALDAGDVPRVAGDGWELG